MDRRRMGWIGEERYIRMEWIGEERYIRIEWIGDGLNGRIKVF